jgi:hypothetical protein
MKPATSLPEWTRSVNRVYEVIERFQGQSVVSGSTHSLVLLPVLDTMAVWEDPANKWEAVNAAPVTMNEARIILTGDGEYTFPSDVMEKASSGTCGA